MLLEKFYSNRIYRTIKVLSKFLTFAFHFVSFPFSFYFLTVLRLSYIPRARQSKQHKIVNKESASHWMDLYSLINGCRVQKQPEH